MSLNFASVIKYKTRPHNKNNTILKINNIWVCDWFDFGAQWQKFCATGFQQFGFWFALCPSVAPEWQLSLIRTKNDKCNKIFNLFWPVMVRVEWRNQKYNEMLIKLYAIYTHFVKMAYKWQNRKWKRNGSSKTVTALRCGGYNVYLTMHHYRRW